MSLFNLKLPSAAGNVLSSFSTKLQESATKVVSSFNGAGPFTKVAAANEAQIDQGAAATTKLIADLRKAGFNVQQQTDVVAQATASIRGSMAYNAVTATVAQDQVAATDQQVSAASLNAATNQQQDDSHIVKLQEVGTGNVVSFVIMPEIAESRSVEYEPVAPPQSPAAFQKYKGTSSVQWTVNATLASRTTQEATENLRIINMLRGWTMPFFGESTRADYPNKLGAPPPVLTFSGFRGQMVGPIPVVITSLQWQFPQDVDYIPAEEFEIVDSESGKSMGTTGRLIPFPTVLKVAIQLVETFSTDQFNGFSLADFRTGQFQKAWQPRPSNGMNSRTGSTGREGGTQRPEPAQVVLPNSLRGGNGYAGRVDDNFSNEGRNAPLPNQNYSNEGRNAGVPIAERVIAPPFRSGGGGDFGGGGADGGWESGGDGGSNGSNW